MKEVLRLEHIQKYYGNQGNLTKAIDDISFSVNNGEFVGIMGASGSGKTTLLNCISTIDTVSAGHIYLDGVDATEIKEKELARFRRENLGFVFQDFNLLDTLTISENIALALTINKVPAEQIDGKVHKMAESLNITDILDKFPYQVSGGQKQRSSIARALLKDAPILIMDDALSAVDTDTEEQILKNLKENRQGKTTILIAHRISTIQNADVIMVLEDGEAKEIGNHASLMALDGIYKSIFEKQQLEAAIGGNLS